MGSPKTPKSTRPWSSRLWNALTRAVSILDQHGTPYVLDGGTLLGFIRDGYFFNHDKDADITLVDQHAALRHFERAAASAGFKVFRSFGVTPDGSAKVQVRYDRALVDVISKHKVGDLAVWVLRKDPKTVKRMPAHYYENRKRITVRGVEFSVPQDAEGYLAARFGSDWRTPKKDWVPVRDDLAYRSGS